MMFAFLLPLIGSWLAANGPGLISFLVGNGPGIISFASTWLPRIGLGNLPAVEWLIKNAPLIENYLSEYGPKAAIFVSENGEQIESTLKNVAPFVQDFINNGGGPFAAIFKAVLLAHPHLKPTVEEEQRMFEIAQGTV